MDLSLTSWPFSRLEKRSSCAGAVATKPWSVKSSPMAQSPDSAAVRATPLYQVTTRGTPAAFLATVAAQTEVAVGMAAAIEQPAPAPPIN